MPERKNKRTSNECKQPRMTSCAVMHCASLNMAASIVEVYTELRNAKSEQFKKLKQFLQKLSDCVNKNSDHILKVKWKFDMTCA